MSNPRSLLDKLRHPESANELLAARVTGLVVATVVIDLAVAYGFYRLERGAPGTEVTSYGDALFWTSSQITTVSSSLRNPITAGGRILAVAVDFASIAVVSLLFGTIAQHLDITSPIRERRFRRVDAEG
ncbi:MAG: voltage-gated potassium channel [Thermoleophilaceae bacterium]|jgi:hypothetical protein|nr:voltage-gated potassium channel [Thermoleophilaceae bacterium]